MTTSILNDALLLRAEPVDKLREYFSSINVTIFDDILSRAPVEGKNTIRTQEPKQIVLFILTAYSEDSPLVILRQDAKEEKEGICEYLGIPDYMRSDLINLKDPMVRSAVTQYLEQFAGFEFKNLMFMKIQLSDFESDITNRRYRSESVVEAGKDGEGNSIKTIEYYYDIKEHGKAVSETLRLSKSINALEKEIKASQGTYKAIDEIREWKTHSNHKGGKTVKRGGAENYIR